MGEVYKASEEGAPTSLVSGSSFAVFDPDVLPNAAGVLFMRMRMGNPEVALLSMETGEWRILFQGGTPR